MHLIKLKEVINSSNTGTRLYPNQYLHHHNITKYLLHTKSNYKQHPYMELFDHEKIRYHPHFIMMTLKAWRVWQFHKMKPLHKRGYKSNQIPESLFLTTKTAGLSTSFTNTTSNTPLCSFLDNEWLHFYLLHLLTCATMYLQNV